LGKYFGASLAEVLMHLQQFQDGMDSFSVT